MDLYSFLLLGVLFGVVLAPIVRLVSIRKAPSIDPSSRRRIELRVRELSRRAPNRGALNAGATFAQPHASQTSRRLLLHDTSGMLAILGATLILAVAITSTQEPTGAVLGVTAAPGGGPGNQRDEALVTPKPAASSPGATASPNATANTALAKGNPQAPEATPGPASATAPPPVASPRPSPKASADRMAVLTPCAGVRDCYIYVVRRGDNLTSIAHWFGVPFTVMLRLNPGVREHSLQPGERITLPTPTR